MSGKPSRDKGARGEREWASYCRAQGYANAVRTAQHAGKNGGQPDVKGLPGVHVEVKRVERLNIHAAMEQAKRDAQSDAMPIVAHRRNNEEWQVTMSAEHFFSIYREWEAGRAIEEAKP